MAIKLSDVQLQYIITKTALAYRNDLYIWDKISPVIDVTGKQGYIPKFGRKHMKNTNFKVGPYSPASQIDNDLTTVSFNCEIRRGSIFIPEEIEMQSDIPISLVTHGMEDLQESMQIEQELELASWMTTSGNFTNSADVTDWTGAGEDILGDVRTAKSTILAAIGRLPNVCVMSPDVFMFLQQHVAEQRMAGGSSKMADGTEIANWMGIPEIQIGYSQYDTTGKKKTISMSQIWGTENVWFFYRSPAGSSNAPSFSYTIRQNALTKTTTDILTDPPGTKFILRDSRDLVMVDETASYYIYGALS